MKLKPFYLLLLAFILLLSAAGCSNGDKKEDEDKAPTKKEQAVALTSWEVDLEHQMSAAYAPISALGGFVVEDPAKFDAAALKTAAGEAATSATDFAATLKDMKVPSDLSKEAQDKVKAALQDLAKTFEAYATAATTAGDAADSAALTEAIGAIPAAGQASFDSFQATMDEVHTTLDILPAQFAGALG